MVRGREAGVGEDMPESESFPDLEGPSNPSSRQIISLIIQGNEAGRGNEHHMKRVSQVGNS